MAKTGLKYSVVIGGGWAGCAAAVTLAQRGQRVTLLEAARTLGGRARRIDIDGRTLDNGQHIMLGAYRVTLGLLKTLAPAQAPEVLLHLPLQMRYPPGSGGMDFVAPRLPAPLHLLIALLRATGLDRDDKLALARFSTTARWIDWKLDQDFSVLSLLERWEQTPRLAALMWRPLCIAALNTPPERASAQIFLNVLRDSLGARRAASDMLIPRLDLSALLPDRAASWLERHGAQVRVGTAASALVRDGDGWQVQLGDETLRCDSVVLAVAPHQAARLLAGYGTLAPLCAQLEAFEYEAITTCYLQYDASVRLAQPFFALRDDGDNGDWGQFVFDRGQLDGQQGLLAVVISAAGGALALPQTELAQAAAAQLARVFQRPELAQPSWLKVISEKRATYACTPGLQRPDNATTEAGLFLAGDYTAGDYPATLEAAVASGIRAASLISAAR
ncbi:MAG TPA: hydroxysqualene dehydroxylase HpnE [Burkholderiaceae bacterium]